MESNCGINTLSAEYGSIIETLRDRIFSEKETGNEIVVNLLFCISCVFPPWSVTEGNPKVFHRHVKTTVEIERGFTIVSTNDIPAAA